MCLILLPNSELRDICPGADVPLSCFAKCNSFGRPWVLLGNVWLLPNQPNPAISHAYDVFLHQRIRGAAERLAFGIFFGSGHCGLVEPIAPPSFRNAGSVGGRAGKADLAGGRDEVGEHFEGAACASALFSGRGSRVLVAGWLDEAGGHSLSVAIEANLDGGERELEHVAFL